MSAKYPIITLNNVSMAWNTRPVLRDVNFTVNHGDFVAITGPNGGGKSTMLRIMLRLLKPSRGGVSYYDTAGEETRRLDIGYLPQKNSIDSHFPITVGEVIASGLLGKHGITREKRGRLLDETLQLVQMEAHRDAAIGSLSGGQLQRTLLGRAIISGPEVLVLDEPLSYLDKHFEHNTYDILESLKPSTTIILVSHDMTTIDSMANRHVIVDGTLTEK